MIFKLSIDYILKPMSVCGHDATRWPIQLISSRRCEQCKSEEKIELDLESENEETRRR